MAEIVLVRHAQTGWSGDRYCGRSDPPLNLAGRATAGQVAAALGTWLSPGTRVISSPRGRALETATTIASLLNHAPIEIDPRWAETDFGIAEGLTFDELAAVAPSLAARLVAGEVDIDWPDGEPADALAARIAKAWDDVASTGRSTLVVTHGGPIRVAVAQATGRPMSAVAVPPPGGAVRLSSARPGASWAVVELP